MFKLLKKPSDYLSAKPVRFFLAAALLWMIIMCVLNTLNGIQWNDILVEANGMAFDLLVFGILLSVYEALRAKKEKIERLKEEIDDYRGWDEKEATYRIVGVCRRLNKLGVTNINLRTCFLRLAQFNGIVLKGANLEDANLEGANLEDANFVEATLIRVDFEGTNLEGANFKSANLCGANLEGSNLYGSNLEDANLLRASFDKGYFDWINFEEETNQEKVDRKFFFDWSKLKRDKDGYRRTSLKETSLNGAIVDKDWFEKLETWKVIGREEIKEKYDIDETGRLQLK